MEQLREKLAEKELHEHFENTARRIIYPDLRAGYSNHEKMLKVLTKALVAVHKMAKEDEANLIQVSEKSVFDTEAIFVTHLRNIPITSYSSTCPYAVSSRSKSKGSGIQSWQYTLEAAKKIAELLRLRGDTHVTVEKKDDNGDLQVVYQIEDTDGQEVD